MILHNDIWGDTSVTLIEEIDNQFLIVGELNMLALYSKLDRKQSKALQEALTTFYEILFSSKDKDKIDDTVPFAPDISFDDDGNGCCTNPYIDFAIVNIKTGEVLVDRVHDKTYTVDDNKDYDQFLAYEWKTVRAWEAKDGKMIFYILPPRGKKAKP